MTNRNPDSIPIAVRVFPEPPIKKERNSQSSNIWRRPDAMFCFDAETTIDASQRLTFGSYRFIVRGHCLEEGIFYADDLPPADLQILREYVSTHRAETGSCTAQPLRLLTRSEFVNRLHKAAYKGRCLIVGFNLPFDLSRTAFDATTARGRFAGGVSLGLWKYIKDAREVQHQYRPRVAIKHIDSKRSLIGFTASNNPDAVDLIPDGSTSGKPEPGYIFRGHFLDLKTLAFALTDKGYSLERACEAFGVKHGKQHVERHGSVTEQYIDYNRRDVLATFELAGQLLAEYDRHPLTLQPTKAYSPASVGKDYLRGMQIKPILQRQPEFPKSILGYAQTAFVGGRASAHIRKVAVPVVFTDFLSMYPTVNSLTGLWEFVTAREIAVDDNCTGEIQQFLNTVTAGDLFNPAAWKKMPAFVKLTPNGDILPTRGKYSEHAHDWQVGVNHLYASETIPESHGMWFSLPDVVASVILTGKVPTVIDAFRLRPVGRQVGLRAIRLRGSILVDPRKQDFFRVVIEERKRLEKRKDLNKVEKERLSLFLKILANAASYGIYAEANRQERDAAVPVICHGLDSTPFTCRVSQPDIPGEYCFPPMAALITGAARLMLALLENQVSVLGGTYAMEDTDSMAIVATECGGLSPCPGGAESDNGQPAIKALSWHQVNVIAQRFSLLNPYAKDAIPGSILKIEEDNYIPGTRDQRQIYCYAISAKRYTLFIRDEKGLPVLLRKGINSEKDGWKQHGLGHLLNPTDLDADNRDWIGQIWEGMIQRHENIPAQKLSFHDLPAVGRVSVSSPAVMRPFESFNKDRSYSEQIKPFNFALTCQVSPLGHPRGADPLHFQLFRPYETDPKKWGREEWIDRYTGARYQVTTSEHYGSRKSARVRTYGEVLENYEFHPEAKCADSTGKPCDMQSVGLLSRRHIRIEQIKYIGKESNEIEDVEAGLIHSADDVYTEYPDPRRDQWATVILPALKRMPLGELIKESGLSKMALCDLRAGRSRPHARNHERLAAIVCAVCRETQADPHFRCQHCSRV